MKVYQNAETFTICENACVCFSLGATFTTTSTVRFCLFFDFSIHNVEY